MKRAAWSVAVVVAVATATLVGTEAPSPAAGTPPSAPRSPSATAMSARARVHWLAPTRTGSAPITAYIVTPFSGGKPGSARVFKSRSTTQVVGGLKNGTAYAFKVAARSSAGTSTASAASNIVIPRTASAAKPATAGFFAIKPPGAKLPTAAACAARVHHSTWEPRADNKTANHTVPSQPVRLAGTFPFNATWQKSAKPRINGNFRGTTDEIIQWAACKWGWSDNVLRAQAVVESHWHQSTRGDLESRSNGHCPHDIAANPCPTSFGIIQVRWYYHPAVSTSRSAGTSYPGIRRSTAFNLDLELAEMRGCYDGRSTYLGNTRGDLWGCLGVWYSGAWHTSGGNDYATRVRNELNAKQWLGWPNQG